MDTIKEMTRHIYGFDPFRLDANEKKIYDSIVDDVVIWGTYLKDSEIYNKFNPDLIT